MNASKNLINHRDTGTQRKNKRIFLFSKNNPDLGISPYAFRVVILFCILLLFTGCAKKEILRQPSPLPIPEHITPEVLLKRVDFSNIRTIRAAIRLGIQQGGNPKGTFSGALFYSHPDRLNIRIFGPLRLTTAMETLFDRGTLQVLIPQKDVLYSGTVAFDRLLPDRNTLANSIKFLEESADMYLLYIIEQGGSGTILRAKYAFSKTDLSWKALELYGNGKRQVRIEIYKTVGMIPSEIGILLQDANFHLELKDISINKIFDDDYFKALNASQTLPLSYFLRNLEQK